MMNRQGEGLEVLEDDRWYEQAPAAPRMNRESGQA